MTLDQFQHQLDNTEQRLMNLTPVLTQIGNEMTAQLVTNAPESDGENAGGLKRSISLTVQPQSFGVIMNAYGVFQNYGVIGYKDGERAKEPRTGQKVPDEIFPKGRGDGGRYKFGAKQPSKGWGAYYTGINKNIGWFSVEDLTKEVTERLGQAITEFFE